MAIDLEDLLHHDMNDDCPICRAQDLVAVALLPAVAAWEQVNELPKFSLALHGAAQLLSVLLREGLPREELDEAVSAMLDDIELQIAEDDVFGGPPEGTA